jgi:serine protease Do
MDRLVRGLRCYLWIWAALFATACAQAATLAPESQGAVRASTFEIVLRKLDADPLGYEKPLPLELIPYAIRTDHFWSIGTAFAIGPNTYVSAAHVLLAAVGSQFGAPALRDAAGHVYSVDQVLKFSAHQDFIVFTVSGAPAATPLTTSRDYKVDDVVFAVGNALGEGVVARDGLLTSVTPEDQDGRWKWLRFSAAASPGNSGGPLLDASGRVIGIVRAKSPNENLNYGLPIGLVLDAPQEASFDLRYSVKLPTVRDAEVATLKTQFALPRSFAEFSRTYSELTLETVRRDQQKLVSTLAGKLFPKGNSGRLLATVYDSALPSFVQQSSTDAWDAVAATDTADQDLPGKGLVSTGNALGVQVFRVRRPDGASDGSFYQNPGAFMDMLLKGVKLPRLIGDQAIRVTSLGHTPQQHVMEDRYGRRWQVTYWPLGYVDSYVACYALPTPEGYVGMIHAIASPQLISVDEYMKPLADAVYVNYSGTLTQWRAFLARRELRPRNFEHIEIELDGKQGLRYRSPRVTLQIAQGVVDVSADSELVLHMAYMLDHDQLSWDVGGVYLYKDSTHHTFVGIERHVKPADESATELLETWNEMRERGPGFNRVAGHDDSFRTFWIHDVASAPSASRPGVDPSAGVLYDVFYDTDAGVYPNDLEERARQLVQATQVLER